MDTSSYEDSATVGFMDGSGAGGCVPGCSALHSDPSSVVLASPLMFEFLVRKAVAENHVGCQHHGNPRDAAFPHVDVLVVIPVRTSLNGPHYAVGGEIPHHYPAWQLSKFNLHELLILQWHDRRHLAVPVSAKTLLGARAAGKGVSPGAGAGSGDSPEVGRP